MTRVHSMSHCPMWNRNGISTRVKIVTYGWVLCYEKANGAFPRETEWLPPGGTLPTLSTELQLSYGLHAFVFPLSLTLKHVLDLTCFTFSSVAVVPVLVPGQRLPTVFDSCCAQVQELMKCVWLIYYRALPQVKTVLLCGKFFLFKRRSLFLRVELWF